MAIVEELIRSEENGTISFGNYKMEKKGKVEDFKHAGDLFKVKTCKEITRLEKNGLFLYESVPGTSVFSFAETQTGVEFAVEGETDAQITVGLAENAEYKVTVGSAAVGTMKTGLSGKLSISVEFGTTGEIPVKISRI